MPSANYSYESHRDLLTDVENKVDTTGSSLAKMSEYAYINDALGRRTSVENSGPAFAATAFNAWTYDDRSELESSKRYTGSYTATPSSGNEVTAQRRTYHYDPIGNRQDYTEGTSGALYYCANSLN